MIKLELVTSQLYPSPKFVNTSPQMSQNQSFMLSYSRFDYLNSLLINQYKYQYGRLQKVQNNAARFITQQKDQNTLPVRKSIHRLPVEQHIEYKILLMVFKYRLNTVPSYLQSLLIPYTPNHHSLRSASDNKYSINKPNKKYGDCAFMKIAPKL